MMTVLMVLDAIISIALILVILGQEAKSGGMGGMDGGSDAVFSGKARGMDALPKLHGAVSAAGRSRHGRK